MPPFSQNGFLWLGDKAKIQLHAAMAKRLHCEHEMFTAEECAVRFPHLRYTADVDGLEWWALWDPNGGTLLADRILSTMQEQFTAHDGVIHDGEKISSIEPLNGGVLVGTDKAQYRAKKVIVASGAWARHLLPDFPVPYTPRVLGVHFWPVREEAAADYTITGVGVDPHRYPNIIAHRRDVADVDFYLIPCSDFPDKVKVGMYRGVDVPDMSDRDAHTRPLPEITDTIAKHISLHMPGLDVSGPAVEKTCVVAIPDDESIVFGRHPLWENVLLAGPMAGTGFTFAPAVGRIMAMLAERGEFQDYDIRPFGVESRYRQCEMAEEG